MSSPKSAPSLWRLEIEVTFLDYLCCLVGLQGDSKDVLKLNKWWNLSVLQFTLQLCSALHDNRYFCFAFKRWWLLFIYTNHTPLCLSKMSACFCFVRAPCPWTRASVIQAATSHFMCSMPVYSLVEEQIATEPRNYVIKASSCAQHPQLIISTLGCCSSAKAFARPSAAWQEGIRGSSCSAPSLLLLIRLGGGRIQVQKESLDSLEKESWISRIAVGSLKSSVPAGGCKSAQEPKRISAHPATKQQHAQ